MKSSELKIKILQLQAQADEELSHATFRKERKEICEKYRAMFLDLKNLINPPKYCEVVVREGEKEVILDMYNSLLEMKHQLEEALC